MFWPLCLISFAELYASDSATLLLLGQGKDTAEGINRNDGRTVTNWDTNSSSTGFL